MRTTVAAAAVAASLALAGCGESQPGYLNMRTLSTDIRSQISDKLVSFRLTSLAALQANLKIDSVVCIASGKLSAECLARYSDGTSTALKVDLRADGKQYISHEG